MFDEHDAEGAVRVGHGGKGERSAVNGDIALGDEIGQQILLQELEIEANGVAVAVSLHDESSCIDMALRAAG